MGHHIETSQLILKIWFRPRQTRLHGTIFGFPGVGKAAFGRSLPLHLKANRIMTMPSQKHLFDCVALGPPLRKLRNEHEIFTNGLCGTSHNFWKLLLGSPHIAKYDVSLHIVDHRNHYKSPLEMPAPIAGSTVDDDGLQYMGYKLENGQDVDLDAPLAPNVYRSKFQKPRWLPEDRFLPLCKPFLCNLKALTIHYDLFWCQLSGRVLITLLNLMQLPSLRYLQFNCYYRPDVIINRAIGENVKHLVLNGHREMETLLRPPHPPLAPLYLDSLSIDGWGFLFVYPACRVQISKLRKLVVRESDCDHVAVWSLLQSCSATLQDFEICPSYACKSLRFRVYLIRVGGLCMSSTLSSECNFLPANM